MAFERVSIRLSGDMLDRLSAYTRRTGAMSDSASVQFILLSFLNQPELYPGVEAAALRAPQDRRTSFSLSRESVAQLEEQAALRRISKADCLRTALYHTLYAG